jgi:hypothetical protein
MAAYVERRFTGKIIHCATKGCKTTFPERLGVHKKYCNHCKLDRDVACSYRNKQRHKPFKKDLCRKPWETINTKELNKIFYYPD